MYLLLMGLEVFCDIDMYCTGNVWQHNSGHLFKISFLDGSLDESVGSDREIALWIGAKT